MKSIRLVSLALVVLVLSSCQKVSEAPPADLGAEVSAEAVSNEFDKVLMKINPFDTKVGDYLFYVTNRKLEQQENPLAIATMGREIKSIESLTRGVRTTIRTVDYTYNYETQKLEVERDEDCVLELSSQVRYTCPSFESSMTALDNPIVEKAVTTSESDLIWVKYYGLQTSEATVTPPARIRDNANCSGLNPCQLHLTYIRYDLVAKYKDGSLKRFRIDRAITPDLRYMGPDGIDFETCISTSVDYQGRPIYLRDCTFLADLLKNP